MNPLPNTFLPSKKTRDFGVSDTVIDFSNTEPVKVAAGTTIAPDTLLLLTAVGPNTVAEATTGTPVIGTDTVFGPSATYSTNSASAAGLVVSAKHLSGMTYRIKVDDTFAATLTSQSVLDGIIGKQYLIASSTDSDGFIHQVLNVTGGHNAVNMLKVVDGDWVSKTVEVEIVG